MKKFIISFVAILFSIILLFSCILGYGVSLPTQYHNTYLAAMTDKYNLLKSTNDRKIVLVGGSNLPFGINSELIEQEIGLKVVNFGLYAGLGSKSTMCLSKTNINKNDIVIFVPEFSPQAYSKYVDGDILLQTLDTKKNMAFKIPMQDWFLLANSYPNYIKQKKEYINAGTTPNPKDVYARSSFNERGDISYLRPYNVMPEMYDTSNTIEIDKKIIGNDFITYFNKYARWVKMQKAEIFMSFSPVNASAISEESNFDKRLEFYDYAVEKFDAKVISNVEDYIMHEDYFYDSNYHLNDSGVIARTVKLIGDLKRELKIFTPTKINVPKGSGADPIGSNVENDNNQNLLAKDFTYEKIDSKIAITGLSEEGKTKSKVTIPMSVDGVSVFKIAKGAFKNCTNLTEIIFPSSVSVYENSLFYEATNLKKITINLSDDANQKLPAVGDNLMEGCNSSAKIHVPSPKVAVFKTDYFWGRYASFILPI